MDVRCSVCGCITDGELMKNYTLCGKEIDVCNFCKKQLDAIAENPIGLQQSARNLLNMNTKGKRSEEVNALLKNHFRELGISTALPEQIKDGETAMNTQSGLSLQAQVNELKNRLDALQASYQSFHRRYIIGKVLGIVLPILLVIIMFIIMIATGALGNLKDYYETIVEYSTM